MYNINGILKFLKQAMAAIVSSIPQEAGCVDTWCVCTL